MSSPRETTQVPEVSAAPVNPEINPESQAAADEAARQAKAKQQKGISATKTILTGGLKDDDENNQKKSSLG